MINCSPFTKPLCAFMTGLCIVNPVEKQNKTKHSPQIQRTSKKNTFSWMGISPKYKASQNYFPIKFKRKKPLRQKY